MQILLDKRKNERMHIIHETHVNVTDSFIKIKENVIFDYN